MGAALSNAVWLCTDHHQAWVPSKIDIERFAMRRARERLIAVHRAGAHDAKHAAINARDRGDEVAARVARKLRREHLRALARIEGRADHSALLRWDD